MTNHLRALTACGLLGLALAAGACSDDDADDAAPGTTAAGDQSGQSPSSAAAPTTTGAPSTALPAPVEALDGRPSCDLVSGNSPTTFDPASGTYAAFLVDGSDPSAVAFDVVQWRETEVESGFEVVNDNPEVRSAPLAEEAEIWGVELSDDGPVGVIPTELPSRGTTAETVYWMTFDDGSIVEICEQYVP